MISDSWPADIEVISTLLPHENADHLESQGVHVTRTDVTKDESVEQLKNFIEKLTGGRLDILINNASVPSHGHLASWKQCLLTKVPHLVGSVSIAAIAYTWNLTDNLFSSQLQVTRCRQQTPKFPR